MGSVQTYQHVLGLRCIWTQSFYIVLSADHAVFPATTFVVHGCNFYTQSLGLLQKPSFEPFQGHLIAAPLTHHGKQVRQIM